MRRLLAAVAAGGLLWACGPPEAVTGAGGHEPTTPADAEAPGDPGTPTGRDTTAGSPPPPTSPDAPVSSPPQPSPPAAVPTPTATPATPRPGMRDPHPVAWETAEPTRGGRALELTWWSGVEPCAVLDHVDVDERPDRVIVTVYEGSDPDVVNVACIEIAVEKTTIVDLATPLGARDIVDGARPPRR